MPRSSQPQSDSQAQDTGSSDTGSSDTGANNGDEEFIHPISALANQLNQIPLEHVGPIRYPSDPIVESLVNDMLERIAQQFEERQNWLANTSHDLRSPITAIMANAELAIGSQASVDDMRHAVEVAHRNARRLAELIDAFMEEATKLGVHGLPNRPGSAYWH